MMGCAASTSNPIDPSGVLCGRFTWEMIFFIKTFLRGFVDGISQELFWLAYCLEFLIRIGRCAYFFLMYFFCLTFVEYEGFIAG